MATLQPSAAAVIAGDTRKWSALVIDDAGGSLQLGGALNATISNVDVQVNSFSGTTSGTTGTPAAALDWTTTNVPGSGITTAIAAFSLSGTITELSIADVIGGTGSFSITKSTVNVATPALTDARLLVFNLTGLNLSSSFGLSLSVTSLTVATLQPSAAAVLAGDTRKWSAIAIDNAGGSLSLGGVISASVANLDVEVNSASGVKNPGNVLAAPIDWTGVAGSGVTLTPAQTFRVEGDLTGVDLAGVVGGSAHFSIAKSTVNVTTPAVTGARLQNFTLSNLTLSTPFGLSITGGSISLVSLLPSAADVIAGDARKWSAISVSGLSGSLTLGGVISASVSNLEVRVNSASGVKTAGNVQAAPLNWTTDVTAAGITLSNTTLFKVEGDLTNVDLAGIVGGGAHFAISKQTVNVTSPALTNARLNVFTLSNLQLSSSFGLSINGGTLSIVGLQPSLTDVAAGDARRWSAISVTGLSASLTIEGIITATVNNLTLKVNSAAGIKNPGGTAAAPIDWTNHVAGAGITLAANETFSVSGELANLDVLGIVTGSADFALKRSVVDIDLDGSTATTTDQLNDANMLMFALTDLSLSVGGGGAGLSIGPGGTLGIVAIKAPVPTTAGVTDNRSWTAITGKDLAFSLTIPGVTATVSGVSLRINKASGQRIASGTTTLASALNWATADSTPAPLTVDLDGAGGWTAPTALVDPGSILPTPVVIPVTYRGDLLAVAGSLTGIDIFGFVTGSAEFEIESGSVAVDLPGPQVDPVTPSLLRLGLKNATLVIGDAGGINISFSGASLALATLKAGAPTAANTSDTRSWLALKGTIALATINGLPEGLVLTVRSLTVEINRASGLYDPNTTVANNEAPAVALNWLTQLDLNKNGTAGQDPDDRLTIAGVPINFTGDFLRASGRLDINLFGFVTGSVAFAFQQQTVDVNVDGGTFDPTAKIDLDNARLTTLALNILGDDGDASNGVETGLFIGAPDKSIGFSVASGSLAIATLKPAAGTANDTRGWTAITANIQNGTFLGGGPLQATVNSLGIEINKAAGALTTPANTLAPLNWTTAVDTNAGDATFTAMPISISVETGGAPIVHQVNYTGEKLRATGSLTIDIFGFVTGTVGFSYEAKTVDARIASGDDLDNASLTLISLSVTSIFIGVPNGPGFTISSGTLALAMLKPSATAVAAGDGRSWMGLTATLGNASLTGIDGLTLALTNVSAQINRGSGVKTAGNVTAAAIDWATAVDDDAAGGFNGADPVVVRDAANSPTTISLSGNSLTLAGTATFDFFGFVTGTATLNFSQTEVNVDLADAPDLVGARLTTIDLTLSNVFIGANGVGFTLSSGTINVASLKPPAPATPGGTPDPRGWTAVSATLNGATLAGMGSGFSLTAQTLVLKINKASGGAVPPQPLDWSKVTGTTLAGAIATLKGNLLFVAGTLTVDIADFVHVSGSFAMEKGDDIFITREGEATTRKVTLMRIGISGGTVFAGVGTAADGVGVSLTNVSLGLALMKDAPGVGTNTYTALKATGTATLVGVDALVLTGTLQVELNTSTETPAPTPPALPKAVDFSKLAGAKLDVKTGSLETDPLIALDFTGRLLRVRGSALITIDSFVFLRADFAFEKDDTPFNVTTDGATPKTGQVTALKIGASNGFAFFGMGGPYWTDSDGDGDIDANDTPTAGAVGLAISNVTLGVALMKPTAASTQLNTYKSFFALKLTGSVALVGIEGFQASITDALVEINDATPVTAGQILPALDLSVAPVNVPTGIGTPDVVLDTDGRLLLAEGDVTLQISEFVFIAGRFGFTKGQTITGMTLAGTGAAAGDLALMTISAQNVHIFAGIGGPYWTDSDGDDDIDANDTPLSVGAKGLALGGVNLSIALLKPTAVGSRKSYFAMSASATSIDLVGVDGVTIGATNLLVEINSASDPTVVAPALPPVLNFAAKPLTVGAFTFSRNARFLGVHATVSLTVSEVSLAATMDFEQTTRPNGTKVIKIALTGVDFVLGDPLDPTFEIDNASALIFVTNLGMAAEFTVPVELGEATGDFYFQGNLSVGINNTNQAVNETFLVDADGVDNNGVNGIDEAGESVSLVLDAGPYLRLRGSNITVSILDNEVTGSFQFEQITRGTQKITRIAMTNVSVSFTDSTFGGVTLTNGKGAFIFYPPTVQGGGVAGTLEGDFALTLGGAIQISGKPVLEINTSTGQATETITLETGQIAFDIAAKTFSLSVRSLDVRIGDFFTLTGDFTVQNLTGGPGARTVYGARNVTLFLGEGPYLLADGTVNPDAVGVVIKNATVGVVKFTNGTPETADDTFAISGWGAAELIGLPGLTVSGTLRIRVNKTGRAISEIINLPGTPAASIPVQFASSTVTEVFEVGVDAAGNPARAPS